LQVALQPTLAEKATAISKKPAGRGAGSGSAAERGRPAKARPQPTYAAIHVVLLLLLLLLFSWLVHIRCLLACLGPVSHFASVFGWIALL
jgi:hypothetical protein